MPVGDGPEPGPPFEASNGVRSIVVICLFVAAAACAPIAERMRSVTYPPELRYIARAEVSESMRQLARHVSALDAILRSEEPAGVSVQAEVVGHLTEMEAATLELDTPRKTTHPMLDQNLEAFRRDVVAARRAANNDPPSYFLAGAVAGSCQYCHRGAAP